MRTYNYSNNELDFLARLAFFDVKQTELRNRAGEDIGNKVWNRIGSELEDDFNLNKMENDYIWHNVSRMYEQDPKLTNPKTRFEKVGLPFD